MGGLLLELNGQLPHANKQISFQKYTFTVVAVDTRKIKKIKVEIASEADDTHVQA